MPPNWTVFLDRDGVITDGTRMVAAPEQLRLIPGSAEAVRRLKEAGAAIVVVTNQPWVAQGRMTEEGVRRVHEGLEGLLARRGAKVDAIYYCPHDPKADVLTADMRYRVECACRKPKAGLLVEASRRFGVDRAKAVMIGDSTRDLLAARNFGCRAVLVRTGNGGKDGLFEAAPDEVFDDLAAAVDVLVSRGTFRG